MTKHSKRSWRREVSSTRGISELVPRFTVSWIAPTAESGGHPADITEDNQVSYQTNWAWIIRLYDERK
jgi:hypothetical protein